MSHNHQISMAGGTVLGIVASISTADVLTTCILAAIGAVVSYLISMLMKRLFGSKYPD
jgi:hypothetical protein